MDHDERFTIDMIGKVYFNEEDEMDENKIRILYRSIFIYILGALIGYSMTSAQFFLPLYQRGEIEFEIDLTIGGDVEDEAYLLNRPSRICVDEAGNIFILDSGENHIKKYDDQGKFIKTFGGPGKGPGEILNCDHMVITSQGHLITWDPGNKRFNFYDNDGIFLQSIPTAEIIRFIEMIWIYKTDPNGRIYIETHEMDIDGSKGGTLKKICQFSSDLKTKNIIDSTLVKDNIFEWKGNTMRNKIVPYSSSLFWAILPAGNIVVVNSNDYLIKIFSPDLQIIKQINHPGNKLKVTSEDKETFFAGLTYSRSGIIKRGASEEIRKSTQFPKFKPFFKDLLIDHEGYILIQTFEKADDKSIYDIFTPEGEFVNQAEIQQLGYASFFRKGLYYDIKTDDDGFPSVVRYRVR